MTAKIVYNVFKSQVLYSEDWATTFPTNQYQYTHCTNLVTVLNVNTYLSKWMSNKEFSKAQDKD